MVNQTANPQPAETLSIENALYLLAALPPAQRLHILVNTIKAFKAAGGTFPQIIAVVEQIRVETLEGLTEKQRDALRIAVKLGWITKEHTHAAVLASLAKKGYIEKGQGVYNTLQPARDLLTPITHE